MAFARWWYAMHQRSVSFPVSTENKGQIPIRIKRHVSFNVCDAGLVDFSRESRKETSLLTQLLSVSSLWPSEVLRNGFEPKAH
ncbi:hypothetical protein llap_18340 [Limosa lapponica baueri]|uniref:Uncharacterized protein n=1 Tax=Limosa lapponica baueri TaxID=1758121 RepID=A0A2I0TC45_LIMLA|nr:hypothetical protein llap_18340 [Limosa lapponica baueri]